MRQEINSEHQPPLQFSKGSKNEIILTSTPCRPDSRGAETRPRDQGACTRTVSAEESDCHGQRVQLCHLPGGSSGKSLVPQTNLALRVGEGGGVGLTFETSFVCEFNVVSLVTL